MCANVTGTRLTKAIHRRLFSRFLSEGGGTSVHKLRQREREKSNRFNEQNNNSARASRF